MVNMNTFFEDSEMSASDNFEIGIYWITKRKYPDRPEERWYPCMYINQNGIITHTDEEVLHNVESCNLPRCNHL